jgi:hypothetical protein
MAASPKLDCMKVMACSHSATPSPAIDPLKLAKSSLGEVFSVTTIDDSDLVRARSIGDGDHLVRPGSPSPCDRLDGFGIIEDNAGLLVIDSGTEDVLVSMSTENFIICASCHKSCREAGTLMPR